MRIYLDDERNPRRNDFVITRTFNEFCNLLIESNRNNDLTIEEVSFDHDLGEEKNGMDCLKFMVELDMDNFGKILSNDFKWNAHTANPCGRDNMDSYIYSYLSYKNGGINE